MAAAGSVGLAVGVGRYSIQVSGVSMATPLAPPLPVALTLKCDSTNSCAASLAGVRSAHRCPAAVICATSASGTGVPVPLPDVVGAGVPDGFGCGDVLPDGVPPLDGVSRGSLA